jgi:hypothetical protein
MAFKFPGRETDKQRVLGIDLARCPRGAKFKTDHPDRAVVVTAERDRLTYFWNTPTGEWSFHTRRHAPIAGTAFGPEQTLAFPWSRRSGVAAGDDVAVVAFKRVLKEGEAPALYIDLLAWSEPDARWRHVTADSPIAVDLGGLRAGVGIDLWAWMLDGRRLQIVTQVWINGFGLPGQPMMPPRSALALLQATIDPEHPEQLADESAWTVTEIDKGGYDLDACIDGDRIWAVHRRGGASMSLHVEAGPQNSAIFMIDEAGNNPFGIDESPFVAERHPTVLAWVDPATRATGVDADDLPPLEHPRLQRVDPVIVTGDHLQLVVIEIQALDAGVRYRPRVDRAEAVVVWRGAEGWTRRRIGPIEGRQWPLAQRAVVGSAALVLVADGRLSYATLLPPKPTALWRYALTSKGVELTFAREDREVGGVACDTYLASPDLRTGQPVWIGRSLFDIGHEAIGRDGEGRSAFPAETTQFDGLAEATTPHADGGNVRHRMPTAVTLGGALVSHQEDGPAFCAYVGMGDGGLRVIFEGKVEPPTPTITEAVKHLPPSIVAGPGAAGRAWVSIEAADFVDARLPSYAAPYGDVMRRMPPPENGLAWAVIAVTAEGLLHHFTPRSISGGLQPLLDVLAVADLLFNPGSQPDLDTLDFAPVTVTSESAASIQAGLAAMAPDIRLLRTRGDQPFRVDVFAQPGAVQAQLPIGLRVVVADAAVNVTAVRWTLTPPTSAGPAIPAIEDEGATITATFPVDGRWRARVEVDDETGRTSRIDRRFDVTPTLWSLLWAAHRQLNVGDEMRLGDTSLTLLRHRIDYRLDGAGGPQSVTVSYLDEVASEYRFEQGVATQQGRARLRLPVQLSSTQVTLTGLLGTVVAVRRADVRFNLEGLFTLGVVTSDRRSLDLLRRETYADLDSTPGAPVEPDAADIETARSFAYVEGPPAQSFEMTPSALAAKPVEPPSLQLPPEAVDVELDLTPAASSATFLLGVVVGLGLAAMLLAPFAILLAAALGPLGPGVVSLAVLVSIAIAAGVGYLFVNLARNALASLGRQIVRDRLTSPDSVERIRDGLVEAQLMTYAGEGLAEAIAIRAVELARDAGHDIPAPQHRQDDPEAPGRPRAASGRERFRDHAFEIVVVGEGECRVLVRVP